MTFPVLINAQETTSLVSWINQYHDSLFQHLSREGAILFRGFSIPNADAFDHVITAFGLENFTYENSLSNAVRTNVTPRVFTANEAPPEVEIFLHHEMAQTPIYPSKLFFYCEVAPQTGGATPLCRSDLLWDSLLHTSPKLAQKFEHLGVRYTNTMPNTDDTHSGQGRSWRSTLSADTKKDAETTLAKLKYDWTWLENDQLRVTSPRLEAVRTLADGRKVFFNQLIAAFRGWRDSRNTPTKSVSYGNGDPIKGEDLQIAIDIADRLTVDLLWQQGDVALIDNFLVMHGRKPFKGKRRVLASLIS